MAGKQEATTKAMEATVAMAVAMKATVEEVNDSDEDSEGESLQETSSFASKHNMTPTIHTSQTIIIHFMKISEKMKGPCSSALRKWLSG